MKKFIALSALSTVLCVASIGAFAQSPSQSSSGTPGAAASTTARHHHKHKHHHHHHAKKAALGATK